MFLLGRMRLIHWNWDSPFVEMMKLIPSPNESLVKFYGPIGAGRVLKLRAAFVPQHEAWHKKKHWLVVWNLFFSIYIYILRITIPTDLHIFQRGRYTTRTNSDSWDELGSQPLWPFHGFCCCFRSICAPLGRWAMEQIARGTGDDLNFIPNRKTWKPFQTCPRRYKTIRHLFFEETSIDIPDFQILNIILDPIMAVDHRI